MLQQLKQFLLSNTNTKQTVAKNTTWLFFGEVTSRIFRAAITIIGARIIGAAGFGLFSYTLALGGIFMVFEDAGIGTYVTRELAKSSENQDRLLATATVLKSLLLGAAIIIFLIFGSYTAKLPGVSMIIPLVALILLFDSLREFAFLISRAHQKMQVESLVKFITSFLMLVFSIWFVLIKPGAFALALGYTLGGFLGFTIILISVYKHFKNPFIYFSKDILRPIWNAAWPFTILIISNVLIFNTDVIFLGHYTSAETVGSYAAAQRLIQICYLLSSLVVTATFPMLSRKASNRDEYRSALEKTFGILLNLAVPVIIGTIIWAPGIVYLLFGKQYSASIIPLQILAVGLIPIYISALYSNAVLALNQQARFIAPQIVGIIVNIVLDILLIPRLQGVGAALASTIAVGVIALLMAITFRKVSRFSLFRYLHPFYIFLGIILMTAASFVFETLHLSVLIGLPISTLLYIAIIVLTYRNFIKKTGFI